MRPKALMLSCFLLFSMFAFSQELKPEEGTQQNNSNGGDQVYQEQRSYETKQTQRNHEWGFYFGPSWSFPKGGIPELKTELTYDNERTRARTGFDFGLKFNFFLNNNWSVDFNAQFKSAGQKVQYSGYWHELGYSEENVNFTESILYFNFPVYANYYLTENIYVKGGIYGSAILSAQRREGNVFSDYSDVGNLYKGGDFGVSAGIGAAMNVFFLEWRYYRGLVDITFDDDKLYNQSVQLICGFKFGG
ncbi:outer membrane beta-barrel protein [Flammeovirga pacifica]|nr:outer membrane beta-barrel protein [Flammeovirga pacifica]